MRRFSLFIFILSIFIISCNSEKFEIQEVGGNLIPTNTEVQLIDTFTVKASTFIMDSIPTSNADMMLVGQYNDKYFGKVKSIGYSKLSLSGDLELDYQNKPVFDSLVFISYYSGYHYGDTTKTQTLNFHRVSQKMRKLKNDTLYNISSFEYDKKPLGSVVFKAKPNSFEIKDYSSSSSMYRVPLDLRIKLDDKLGKHIFDLAIQHSDTLKTQKKWEEIMPGFCLVSNATDNAAVIGLHTYRRGHNAKVSADTLMKLRFYYHEKSGKNPNTAQHYDFKLGDSRYLFNQIVSDREGTPLAKLKSQEKEISSDLTNDFTYIEGGIGIKTKLEIPYLRNLFQLGITGSLLKAELLVFPQPRSFNHAEYSLPKTFTLARCDGRNRVIDMLPSSRNSKQPLLATLVEDRQYEEDYYYSFDITSFVNSVLANAYPEDIQSLILDLYAPANTNSVDRIILSNSKRNSDLKFKIKATYVVQKSE